MGLTIGELTGYITLDESGVDRGAKRGEAAVAELTRDVLAHLNRIEARDPHVDVDVDADVRDAERKLDRLGGRGAKVSAKIKDSFVKDIAMIRVAFGGLGDTAGGFIKSSVLSVTNLPLFAAIIEGATSAVGAIGVIPAAAGAAALGVIALKIAFGGLGDAMKNIRDPKKFAEDIKDLPGELRATLWAVHDLIPAWDKLKKGVQIQVFKGLSGHVKALGETYLPVLSRILDNTGVSFNSAAHDAGFFFRESSTVSSLTVVMRHMNEMIDKMRRGLRPLLQIFLDLMVVGSTFLPAMGEGFANGARRAADFVREARNTGKLREWIQTGIDSVKKLVRIVVNLGLIFHSVLKATGVDGVGFLDTLNQLIAKILEWTRSAEGQEKIRQVFEGLGHVAIALLEIIPHITGAIFALASMFAALPGPVQTVIGAFIGWGGLLAIVGGKLLPLVLMMGKAGAAGLLLASRYGILGKSAKATALATEGGALRIVGAWARAAAAGIAHVTRLAVAVAVQGARAVASMAATAAGFLLGLVSMAVGAAVHVAVLIGHLAAWAAGVIAQGARAVASMVATAAAYVLQWTVMAAGAMARAAVMAAAWFVAMGPIGWIILAIAGLAAVIFFNWDAIWAKTKEVWDAVWGFLQQVWEWIEGKVADGIIFIMEKIEWLKTLPDKAREYFGGLKDAALQKLMELIDWVTGLPGRLLGALGDLGSLLLDAGHSIVDGLWNGIERAGTWLKNKIMGWIRTVVPGPILGFLGIGSPSKWAEKEAGHWLPPGIAKGALKNSGVLERAMTTLAGRAGNTLRSALAQITASIGGAGGGALSGPAAAAQQILDHLTRGGQMFEDFSFKGNSDLVRTFNDQIADAYAAAGVGDQRRFLQDYIRTARGGGPDEAQLVPAPRRGDDTDALEEALTRALSRSRLDINLDRRDTARFVNQNNRDRGGRGF